MKKRKGSLDNALDKIANDEKKRKENIKYLDIQLRKVENIDTKISNLEKDKQVELSKMGELMDLAVVSKHVLQNGYTVKPADTRALMIEDIPSFLKWLKVNKKPQEIVKFFTDGLKLTSIKDFCNREAADQRVNGVMVPKIGGINLGEITYRRLTTYYKKGK